MRNVDRGYRDISFWIMFMNNFNNMNNDISTCLLYINSSLWFYMWMFRGGWFQQKADLY